ncbi:MAG: hypothetical protein DMG58_07415 [Acidobacteria bacterium]|nr:MAG: hypothetical protein DMG58_07415 [Acidobacteriota bacterium]
MRLFREIRTGLAVLGTHPDKEKRVKTVLLVNDDTAGLIALALILRSHGYGVLESSDGDEAIHVCLEHRGPIDLLLMDFELGGSNAGPQLAERLLELSPEMQVLFMFSSPPNKLLEVGILPWGCVFLRKPFGPEALVRIVQESFGGVPSIPRKLAVGVESPTAMPCTLPRPTKRDEGSGELLGTTSR